MYESKKIVCVKPRDTTSILSEHGSGLHPQYKQAALRAVPMTLFPTMGSLNEVVELANSQLPLANKNTLFSILCIYHNTLLLQQLKEKSWA